MEDGGRTDPRGTDGERTEACGTDGERTEPCGTDDERTEACGTDGGRTETCSTWTMMSFNKEFEDFRYDDNFDGSLIESQIFTEVLFGNNCSMSFKRCLVTGVINFENEFTKPINLGSASGSSVLTSQAESSDAIRDSADVEKAGMGFLQDDITLPTRGDHDVSSSPVKLAVDYISHAKPSVDQGPDTSIPSKEVVCCASDQPSEFLNQVTCHLVESDKRRIASSLYLLKQSIEMNRVCEPGEKDTSKYRLSAADGSEQKELVVKKAIASPVSQESLVCPSTAAANKGTPRSKKPRWDNSCFVELDEGELPMLRDSKNDPRSLLRYHVYQLLEAAGWAVGRRRRLGKSQGVGEYVFRSPEGRPIREFHRAWTTCGEHLLFYANNVLPADDCKIWTDMAEFRCDLSSTVTQLEEHLGHMEPTAALAYKWCLLDPFANFMFIDKTIRSLKEGTPVKAKRSLVIVSQAASRSCLVSNDTGNLFPQDPIIPAVTKFRSVSCSETSMLDGNPLPACGSQSTTSAQTGVSEIPLSSWNAHTSTGGSETICLQQDYNGSCNKTLDRHFESRLQGSVYVKSNCSRTGCLEIPNSGRPNRDLTQNKSSPGKSYKKSRKISKVNLTSLYKHNKFGTATSQDVLLHDGTSGGIHNMYAHPSQRSGNLKRKGHLVNHERASKKSKTCRLKDDDLIVSAIIKNKPSKSTSKKAPRKSRSLKKRKSQKGSCRLLLRTLKKGGKQLIETKWSAYRSRTVLSWLLQSGVVSENEVIQYRNTKDDSVVKDGLVTWEGIVCKCCNNLLSVSEFKSHAGCRLNRPCLNLFMESGKPLMLCQLEAWSTEYKAKKGVPRTIQIDEVDQNDDSCGRCGDVGELICCDNCPSTFHQACLYSEDLPEGSWYCPRCTCRICGNLVNDKEDSEPPSGLKCSQCEFKYHEACMEKKGTVSGMASDAWFCGTSCLEVYSGLQSHIGFKNSLPEGCSWTLLRCIPGDHKVHSAQRFVALKAECNSKLAVALTIMEECFLPMVDPRTGIDMIPHVVYNWGSQFARLNYCGFYTVVLEKDDVMTSVASIRVHGVTVAEMPLIATCSKYRRQGMCRRLLNSIEEMLRSFKVEKLVISAIPSLVETWTEGFGFRPLEDDERQTLRDINLMVFPGAVWLKKPLYNGKDTVQMMGEHSVSDFIEPLLTFAFLFISEDSNEKCWGLGLMAAASSHHIYVSTDEACLRGTITDPGQLALQNNPVQDIDAAKGTTCSGSECWHAGVSSVDGQLPELSSSSSEMKDPKHEDLDEDPGLSRLGSALPNLFSENPDLPLMENRREICCHVEAL